MNEPIVVGVDGSAEGWAALQLAGWEAAMRHRPLQIAHAFAWPWPTFHLPERPPPDDLEAISLYAQANDLAAAAVAGVRHARPTLTVCGEVIIGFPAPVLTTASQTAAMVVIGHRSIGKLDRLLRGSVAGKLTTRPSCPVLVSRGRPDPSGNVLLSVDAASTSNPVVDMAIEEAMLRGVAVDVPTSGGTLAHTHTSVRDRTPAQQPNQHPSTRALTRSRKALIDATVRAQLVVIGIRSGPVPSGRLLPSASQTALHHAHCPVLMVPVHDPTAAM